MIPPAYWSAEQDKIGIEGWICLLKGGSMNPIRLLLRPCEAHILIVRIGVRKKCGGQSDYTLTTSYSTDRTLHLAQCFEYCQDGKLFSSLLKVKVFPRRSASANPR